MKLWVVLRGGDAGMGFKNLAEAMRPMTQEEIIEKQEALARGLCDDERR